MRHGLITGAFVAAGAALAIPLVATADHRPGHDSPPASGDLTIAVSKNPVPFPQRTTISGRVRGDNTAGRTVVLQHNPHPHRGGLKRLARTTTNDKGEYSFTVRPDRHTFYRTASQPGAQSAELFVRSRMRVTRRVSDRTPMRGQSVRFSGVVVPAHDGSTVLIQRLNPRRGWRNVASATLTDAGPEQPRRSLYSRNLRIFRDGVFRTIVKRHADHLGNKSRRIRLDVP